MRLALDAMGGDHAPQVTVAGAVDFVNLFDDIEVILVGDEQAIENELAGARMFPEGRLSIEHASQVIEMGEAPSQAIRKKKDSSLARAVELVKQGRADAIVSAGNSGAAMALALLKLRKMPGVDRPAIATIMPVRRPFVLLDAGANVNCSAMNMLQFAQMGSAYCKIVLGRRNPKVALLSIGEEATKGNELTKTAFKLLEKSDLNFIGNVEGKDMFQGKADVVVCDGFAGNVVLKTSEGIAEETLKMLKREIVKIFTGRLGYMLLKPAINSFKRKTDYAEYGGAPLLGISGNCIISHGRSTSVAIRNALRVASELSRKGLQEMIAEAVASAASPEEKTVVAG